jgi:hypothetical protein
MDASIRGLVHWFDRCRSVPQGVRKSRSGVFRSTVSFFSLIDSIRSACMILAILANFIPNSETGIPSLEVMLLLMAGVAKL